jgi:hypothetical protein
LKEYYRYFLNTQGHNEINCDFLVFGITAC